MNSIENQIISELVVLYERNKNTDLAEHLYRAFKKAERDDFFTICQFFDPLAAELQSTKEKLSNQFKLWKAKHEKGFQKALNNQFDSWNLKSDYLTSQKNGYEGTYDDYKADHNKRLAASFESDLSSINLDNFITDRINLLHPHLTINKINIIMGAIDRAKGLISQRQTGIKLNDKNKAIYSNIDIPDLEYQLKFVYDNGTIDSEAVYNLIKDATEALPDGVPDLVKAFLLEFDRRISIADNMVKKGIIWEQSKQDDFKIKILGNAQVNSFDAASKKEFLKKEFTDRGKDLERMDTEFKKEFDYPLRSVFIDDLGKFTATKDSIIEFFFNCESFKKDCSCIYEIARKVTYYFNTFNEQQIIKDLLEAKPSNVKAGKNDKPSFTLESFQEALISKAESNWCPNKEWDRKYQVEVAAFVESIWAAGWMGKNPRPDRPSTCISLAASRYGVDIATMIKASKKKDREPYIAKLKKHFPVSTNFDFSEGMREPKRSARTS